MGKNLKLIKSWIAIVASLFIVALFCLPVQADVQDFAREQTPYKVDQYHIRAEIDTDGIALVQEFISFQVHEDIRDYSFEITKPAEGRVDSLQIVVSDPADEAGYNIEALPADNGDDTIRPMTYHITEEDDTLGIKLHVFSTAESTRNVTLTYEIGPLVERHHDSARLMHRFFTTSIRGPINQPTLQIKLPEPVLQAQLWVLPVSQVNIENEHTADTLSFSAAGLSSRDYIQPIVLLPASVFPYAPEATEVRTWEQLTHDARTLQDDLREDAKTRQLIYWLVIVLLVLALPIGLAIFMLFDYENAHQESNHKGFTYELPNVPPAMLACFLRQRRPGRLVLATLFDLVQRGELDRDGYLFTRKPSAYEPYIGYKAYEIFLLTWLFDHVADHAEQISVSEIRRYARESGNASDFRIYFNQFIDLLNEAVSELDLYDQKKTNRGRFLLVVAATAYTALAIMILLMMQISVAILLFIPAFFFLVYSFYLRHLNHQGMQLYRYGKALKRTLKNLANIPRQADPAFYIAGLPFAISFGMPDYLINHLSAQFKNGSATASLEHELAIYQLKADQPYEAQLEKLKADIDVMTSLINSSILLSGGIH